MGPLSYEPSCSLEGGTTSFIRGCSLLSGTRALGTTCQEQHDPPQTHRRAQGIHLVFFFFFFQHRQVWASVTMISFPTMSARSTQTLTSGGERGPGGVDGPSFPHPRGKPCPRQHLLPLGNWAQLSCTLGTDRGSMGWSNFTRYL